MERRRHNRTQVTVVGIALVLMGITFLLTAPVAAQEPTGGLNVSSETVEASPGESVTINSTVQNDGERELTQIDVWFTDAPEGWNTSNTTIERLSMNASETVSLTVEIADNATPGEYTLTVRAESRDNISDEALATIQIPNPEETPTSTEAKDNSSPTTTESFTDGGHAGPTGKSCTTIPFTDKCLPSISDILDDIWPF